MSTFYIGDIFPDVYTLHRKVKVFRFHCSIYYIDVPQILVGTVYYTARTYPTNKTQVFNEISIMENWLIIHVINSRTPLVLYSW